MTTVKYITDTRAPLKSPTPKNVNNINAGLCAMLISSLPQPGVFHLHYLLSMSSLYRWTMPSTTEGSASVLTSPSSFG